MKRRFTILTAALALLAFLAIPMGMWGQTTVTYKLTIDASDFNTTSYAANNNEKITNAICTTDNTKTYEVHWTSNQVMKNGNNMQWQKNNGKIYNSTNLGAITNVTVTSSAGTFTTYYGTSAQPSSSTTVGGGYFQTKVGNATGTTSKLEVTFQIEEGGSTPSISVSPSSINFGSVAINPSSAYEESFEVSFTNLTQNLTVSVGSGLTGVSVNPTTISKTATSPQTVTVSYNPTEVGTLNGNITVSNTDDNLSETVAVTGSAYDPASIPTYTLVSDVGTLQAGDIIILGCASKSAVAGAMGTNAYFTKVDATFTDGTVTTNAAIQITLGGSADAWTLTTNEGQIGVSSTNLNHEGTGTTTWTITISNNVAHINGGSNNGDIQYNASSPRFKTYTSSQTSIEIYKLVNENQVATPTFGVEAGTYLSAQSVSISCETEGATIQYKTTENGEWQTYNTPINVNETMTIWARAIKTGMDDSDIITATYTILIIEHAGTEADPYSVADARNLIDQGEPYPEGVYATGIVCRASNSLYSGKYLSYYISTDGSAESDQLEAYNGLGINGANFTSVDDVQVGDVVVIYGNLTKYNNTYEFAANNHLVSLVRPLKPIINAEDVSIAYNDTSGSIAYTIDNVVEGGVLTATTDAQWITLGTVGTEAIPFTCSVNDQVAGRSATVTLTYTYNTNETVTKTITINQTSNVPTPGDGNYVRITSLDQLTNGSIVVFAARYNENATNYYAMKNTISGGKASGVAFVSTTSNGNEILPVDIVDEEDDYYWVVNETEGGYTFTNANGQLVGWLSGPSFNLGESEAHNEWTISTGTTGSNSLIATYSAFNIKNANTSSRAFAFRLNNTTSVFGPYAISGSSNNSNNSEYNFSLDIFVQTSTPVTEPITLDIAAWTTDQNGVPGNWYLITSPLADPIDPADVGNMIPENLSNVDLYRFDQEASLEWVNYRTSNGGVNENFGDLIAGTGYLYANANDVQLRFTGTPYSGNNAVIPLSYYTNNQDSNMHGVNLIGNPFNVETTIGDQDFYRMNPEGRKEIVLAYDENTPNPSIAPMEGIFVHATGEGESVTFSPSNSKATRVVERTWIELCQNDLVIDRASIRYGEGTPLPKIQLNENNTKIYFPMEDGNYSVIIGNYQDEVPLNFMAATAGTYTLNFTNQNAEFNTLILVDNQTNTQVNLLNNPSYSFSAQTTDDEARFIVVYQRASSYLTIGTGDLYSASGNNSSDSTKDGMGSPVGNTYYTASTAQFIYMASEMEGAKTIRSLAFYHNNQGPFVGTVKIYLAHTSASQVYTSNPATSGTLVYEGTNINIGSSSAGWQTFTLDTPFPYNGTDNLLVVVCRTKATSGNPNYDADQGWKYTSYSQHYYYMQRSGNSNDTYGNIATAGNYARGFKRPNIKIGYTAPVINHFDLDIDGWTSNGNYYLIASPIGQVAPTAVDNMLSNSYDLYYFDQDGDEEGYEWITYKPGNGATDPEFDLVPGKGYLYANSGVAGNNPNVVTLTFTGWGYTGSGQVDLTYSEANSDPNMRGWNLVGNPFGVEAYIDRPFYRMNGEGSEINGESETGSIGVMEGVFVHATQSETMTFTTTPPTKDSKGLALDLSNGRNVIDRAIVRFDEGQQLPKLQLNKNNTKLYISQDNKDYAIVCAEEQGEMPVSFKAEDNGTYSLSFSSENVEFAYLHLIDNMTGADVDLLQTPSYSFEAKSTDYASRFKLVFATGDNANANFAFFSNGSFVINNEGNATLQVIDVTGRILKSESINGCASVDVNAAPGVYMLRLVNGDNVKVQKVVIR